MGTCLCLKKGTWVGTHLLTVAYCIVEYGHKLSLSVAGFSQRGEADGHVSNIELLGLLDRTHCAWTTDSTSTTCPIPGQRVREALC